MFDKTPIFIPVDTTKDAVESDARKILVSSGPGGMDSESPQGWLLKFGEDRKILLTSVETSVDWLSNKIMPWVDYCAFMSLCLIVIEKQPDMRPVGVGETWKRIFYNIVLKFIGPEATIACLYEQICAGLK